MIGEDIQLNKYKDRNNICLFCAKYVGEQILTYLIDDSYQISKVVIPNYNEKIIVKRCKSNSIRFESFEDFSKIDNANYNWLINAWSPIILNKNILKKFKKRINLHPSYLPWGKGSHGATWSIIDNSFYGVSLLEMNEKIDSAKVYVRKRIQYDISSKGRDLAEIGKVELINLFKINWPMIYNNKLQAKINQKGGSYHTIKKIIKDKEKISDESMKIIDFIKWINAHDFYPHSTAIVVHDSKKYEITINICQV